MDCSVAREALSAQLDGEVAPLDMALVSSHVDGCAECQVWKNAAEGLHRTVRVAPADEIPDLTPAILVAMGDQRASAKADALRACRWLLGICAGLQLLTALSPLFGGSGGPIHLDHELGSWDIGLAFAFLIAALQPSRAWGMLPFLFVVAGALGVTSLIDISSGHISATRESTHVSELMGFAFTYLVARFSAGESKLRLAFS